ncbi:unnamed protein product [Microthlaspi erraticum]|uniref:BTB domain-containing protein n=1 Tax=Microthlaspi erraticum TaxID=1685480 RepID=A0A6D2ILX2_9BRAS|nr:unnamed protein product [Microthlaspi erraticum]
MATQSPEIRNLLAHDSMVDEVDNKMDFFGGLMNAFMEQRHVDVWLKAGDETDAIPAHKLILVARSRIFKYMLESDDCKGPSKDTITLSEMTRDELETFLEYMYNGWLVDTTLAKHVHGLYAAADKYEVPYLQDICRNKLIASLDPSNAFDVLDLAKTHSDRILEDEVYKFFTSQLDEISMSSKFESFVEYNPALTVRMIRGYVNKVQTEEAFETVIQHFKHRNSCPSEVPT